MNTLSSLPARALFAIAFREARKQAQRGVVAVSSISGLTAAIAPERVWTICRKADAALWNRYKTDRLFYGGNTPNDRLFARYEREQQNGRTRLRTPE